MKFLNLPWERCWCFRTVRTGSIASAVYAVVGSIFRIIGAVVERMLSLQKLENLSSNVTFSREEAELEMEITMSLIELLLAFLPLIAGISLLIGIYKNFSILLLPFIIMFMITVGIEIILAGVTLLLLVFLPHYGVFLLLAFIVLFIFVDTSCLLCVISHFMNIRAGREPMRAVYRRQGHQLAEGGDDDFHNEAALPTKVDTPAESGNYTRFSDQPIDGEAPPPYRDV